MARVANIDGRFYNNKFNQILILILFNLVSIQLINRNVRTFFVACQYPNFNTGHL